MYPTKLGALISIAIRVLVAIILVQKSVELVDMNEPTLQIYSRPLYKSEVEDYGAINTDEYHFNFGV